MLYIGRINPKTPMRTMKLFAAALLISVAGVASAQSDAKACADMAKAKAELITKELKLNDEQAAKVEALLVKNEENLVGMRGHCEVMDAKAKKADEATYASINDMLDPKQQELFQNLRDSGKLEQCGKEGGKGCCAGGKDAKKTGKAELNRADAVKASQTKDNNNLQRAKVAPAKR